MIVPLNADGYVQIISPFFLKSEAWARMDPVALIVKSSVPGFIFCPYTKDGIAMIENFVDGRSVFPFDKKTADDENFGENFE